jgi:alpha-beta hydrolase superfamily lysophospholipase
MQAQQSTFRRPDGVGVHLFHWTPDAGVPVRGVVQILHGLAEHGARYARFAEALTAAGWVVVADDHRGHGKTAADATQLGHFGDHGGFEAVVDDLVAIGESVRIPGLPWVVFGHSMGSTLALHLLKRVGGLASAAVLTGPTGQVGPIRKIGAVVARLERLRLGRRGRSHLLHQMSFGDFNKPFKPARTPMDWLSRDPIEVDKYVADPACGFVVTAQFWCDLLPGLEAMYDDGFVSAVASGPPMLVLAGDQDPVGGFGKQVRAYFDRLRAAGHGALDVVLYPEARHELLNETHRDVVTDDILRWLDRRVPRPDAQRDLAGASLP